MGNRRCKPGRRSRHSTSVCVRRQVMWVKFVSCLLLFASAYRTCRRSSSPAQQRLGQGRVPSSQARSESAANMSCSRKLVAIHPRGRLVHGRVGGHTAEGRRSHADRQASGARPREASAKRQITPENRRQQCLGQPQSGGLARVACARKKPCM